MTEDGSPGGGREGREGAARLFRPVPPERVAVASAVLATCPCVVTTSAPVHGERVMWELVEPCAAVTEFAAAVVVSERRPAARSARVVTVAVSAPDVPAAAVRALRALAAELARQGVEAITVSPARAQPMAARIVAAAGFRAGRAGDPGVTRDGSVWLLSPE